MEKQRAHVMAEQTMDEKKSHVPEKLRPPKAYGSSLLTIENAKTIKGESLGYLTGILYLAPANESAPFGGGNLCPMASAGCVAGCLFKSGRGTFNSVYEARIRKTLHFFHNRAQFLEDLEASIIHLVRMADRMKLRPAVRLNGTSDYPFYKAPLMVKFTHVQFYNYTKIPSRMFEFLAGKMRENEHLTFSRSEKNEDICAQVLAKGGNVAAVFDTGRGHALPSHYMGAPVIDGDLHDVRFLDPRGVVVGLRAKGPAKRDTTGFVIRGAS
jgi:hypothetical protein